MGPLEVVALTDSTEELSQKNCPKAKDPALQSDKCSSLFRISALASRPVTITLCSSEQLTKGKVLRFLLCHSKFLRNEPVCSVGRAFRDNFYLSPSPLPPPATILLARLSFFISSRVFFTQKASILQLSTPQQNFC